MEASKATDKKCRENNIFTEYSIFNIPYIIYEKKIIPKNSDYIDKRPFADRKLLFEKNK